MKLIDTFLRGLKATGKVQKYSDGGGLYIHVTPQGSKLWRMAYQFNDKQKTLSFGAYPAVSLKDARQKREEAKEMLEFLRKSKSFGRTECDWNKGGSDYKKLNPTKKPRYSSKEPLSIEVISCYSNDKYTKIIDFVVQNKKMQEQAKKDLDLYDKSLNDAQEITTEIRQRWLDIHAKFERLDGYVRKFKNDYLPLADGNTEMAIKFLAKAFNLTTEEQDYILDKHKEEECHGE